MSEKASGVRDRLAEELKTMSVVFLYLAAFLGAFTMYRRLVLDEYNIHYLHYGYSIIEALILSKVIVFGSALKVGERFRGRPLIVPTLYKTASFGVLVLAFSVVEHILEGWFHGKTTLAAVDAIFEQGTWELLARVLVILVALVPMFAVWETGRAMGEGKLWDLFFHRGPEAQPGEGEA